MPLERLSRGNGGVSVSHVGSQVKFLPPTPIYAPFRKSPGNGVGFMNPVGHHYPSGDSPPPGARRSERSDACGIRVHFGLAFPFSGPPSNPMSDRSRSRNFPQQPAPARGGTLQRNIYNNRPMPGEVNETGLPIGTPRPTPAPRPFAQNLTSFQSGGGTPALDAMKARNFPARPASGPVALPTPANDEFGRPMLATPSAAAPAPAAPTHSFPALPTNPGDRALLMETRARDAADRAPEAPRPIPAGDPAARAWNLARGTGHPSTPEPFAPVVAPGRPDQSTLAVAGTGHTLMTPWGPISSTLATPGSAQTPALWSNTGVVHPPARVPEAATVSPMSVPGYYPPEPLAASAAPPQAAPPPRFPTPLAATGVPEAATAPPPQAPALPPGMPSRTSLLTGASPAPMMRPSASFVAPPQAGAQRIPEAATARPPQSQSPGAQLLNQSAFRRPMDTEDPLSGGMSSPSRASLLTGAFPRPRKPAQALLENQDQ